jgi:hypothetical protein
MATRTPSGPAIAKGAIGLLTKPLDFTLLREEIDTRLGLPTDRGWLCFTREAT